MHVTAKKDGNDSRGRKLQVGEVEQEMAPSSSNNPPHSPEERGPRIFRKSSAKAEIEKLNKIFNNDVAQLERAVFCMDFNEKSVATEWIAKLKNSDSTLAEMRARNDITAYLLKCINQNIFGMEPFKTPPPIGSIITIKSALPLTHKTSCLTPNPSEKVKYIYELFQDAADNGEFLSQLPVPREGAFFILHLRPIINQHWSEMNNSCPNAAPI